MPPDQSRIASLDGLRGLACLLVFHSHWISVGYIGHGSLRFGRLGVCLFFVLSGFLMGALYRNASSFDEVRTYVIKRFFRVYPVFFCASLILLLVALTIGIPFQAMPSFTFHYFTQQILLQKGWGAFWTIPVEMHFYLLFAGILLISLRFIRLRVLSFFLLAAWFPATQHLPDLAHTWIIEPHRETYAMLWRFMGIFFAGAAAGCLYSYRERVSFLQPACNAACLTTTLFLILCMLPPVNGYLASHRLFILQWRDVSFLAPLVAIYILCAAWANGKFSWPLNSRFLVYTGKISYSLYLVHLIVFHLLVNHFRLSHTTGIFLSLLLSYTLAALMYRFIEKPGIALGASLNEKLNRKFAS